ncbi:hypothetical protein [Bifidobacterium myosotis]|uniref:Uncharacterized protein n=1 Tax=Bifidobacterium myosotis TaxID=1630166 RepID=A0A5M9ZL44_9BIFI|nr:hypothetical protein [Bifidobacterium myosotis]KAA8828159.1 hypothetical protein EMO91_06885 [Bifidobacterium myosotis]
MMTDVAVKAGVRFTVLDETLLAGIPLEPAGLAVDVDGRRLPLMRGRSYADSARIDALMDEYGDMPLRGHVAGTEGK